MNKINNDEKIMKNRRNLKGRTVEDQELFSVLVSIHTTPINNVQCELRSLWRENKKSHRTQEKPPMAHLNIFLPDRLHRKKYHGVLIFGAPASGKGTQSELITKEFGYVHLSTGEILRSEVKKGSPLGKEARTFMDAGKLIPDNLIISMIKGALEAHEVTHNGWLLDGFPRTDVQAKALEAMGCHPDLIISLEVPDDILMERVTGRREDPVTKKIYHLKYDPPPEDVLGRCTQRSDDTAERLETRLKVFHVQSKPIIDYYRGNDDPILVVDGTAHKDQIYSHIQNKLSEK